MKSKGGEIDARTDSAGIIAILTSFKRSRPGKVDSRELLS
jgi:hypothetical protein